MSDYLAITEASSYVTVQTSDWKIVFNASKGGSITQWYTSADDFTDNLVKESSGYTSLLLHAWAGSRDDYAVNSKITVLEAGANRVVIRATGDAREVYGGTGYTQLWMTSVYYVYSNGIIVNDYQVENDSGTNLTSQAFWIFMLAVDTTSATFFADNSSDASPTYNTKYWAAGYDSALNLYASLGVVKAYDSQVEQTNYLGTTAGGWATYYRANQTWNDGETIRHICVLDIGGSATDEAGVEARLSQFVPAARSGATINTGTAQTDWVFPDNIDTDGFASDGARYLLHGTKEVEIEFNQAEISPAIILDFPLQTGDPSSPDTSTLKAYYKCDDNAASSTVEDSSGNSNDANWEDCATQSNRNTSNDSITDAVQGRALDTQGAYFIDVPCGSGTDFDNDFYKKGSVIIKFKPQFAYNVAGNVSLFEIYTASGELLRLYYDAADDKITFDIDYGTVVEVQSDAFTSDAKLQQYMTIHCAWDSDNDIAVLAINGKVIGTVGGLDTPSISDPSIFVIGTDDSYTANEMDCFIDDIKIYNGAVLPYGAFFTGNGEVDTDIADAHILFYSALNDITSPVAEIAAGSGTITVGGSPTLATGVGGVANNAIEFDASGEILSIASASNLPYVKGQVAFWYKSNSALNDSTNHMIFGDWGGSFSAGDFAVIKGSDNYLYFVMVQDGQTRYVIFNTVNNWTGWNFYQFCWDSERVVTTYHLSVFQNGKYITPYSGNQISAAWTASAFNSNMGIGNDYSQTSNYADGVLQHLYILDDPLVKPTWTIDYKPIHLPIYEIS